MVVAIKNTTDTKTIAIKTLSTTSKADSITNARLLSRRRSKRDASMYRALICNWAHF